MLEIKHVTKIYKTKGGVSTKALDDVSISFSETGLVFLLGKSGSGKSTLLNVSGGLDEPTSGEIIVKGKSSKEFSGSDFDSYRNTFVGFVFQEYNVLDEFNVEDNIALALELQGKPKDRIKINALLEEVDLQNFAKRKPNTLSGGQKQRIAIARALIKDPQIIMADEPTGALDSATGRQVFDTLKKLSETRLVIVVSHDREFAEQYGDRIVELKDGKIISDVSKRSIPPTSMGGNLSASGKDTLCIKRGAELNEVNFKAIRAFISAAEGDVIISRGGKEVAAFRKANRMGEDGSAESFSDTAESDVDLKQYAPADRRFIRSRLPAVKAIKIGASGLKLKPVRLAFTIFLSVVAFTMFGLFSTLMTYNGDAVAASTFVTSGGDYLNVDKNYHYRYVYPNGEVYDNEYSYNYTKFTPAEVESFKSEFGSGVFGTIGRARITVTNAYLQDKVSQTYYVNTLSKFTQTENGTHTIPLTVGEYPKADDEICISSYLVSVFEKSDFYLVNSEGNNIDANGNVSEEEVAFSVKGAQSLVGKYLAMSQGGKCFKVTGVFDSGAIDPKFDTIRNGDMNEHNMSGYMLIREFESYLEEGLCQLAIVNDKFYENYGSLFDGGSYEYIEEFDYIYGESIYITSVNEDFQMYCNAVKVYNSENAYFNVRFFEGAKNTLADDEVALPVDMLDSIVRCRWDELNPCPEEEDYIDPDTGKIDYDSFYNAYNDWIDRSSTFFDDNYYNCFNILYGYKYDYDEEGNSTQRPPTKEEIDEASVLLNERIKELTTGGFIPVKISSDSKKGKNFKFVGWFSTAGSYNVNYGIYVSQTFYDSLDTKDEYFVKQETNYVAPDDAIYDGIYIPYDHTESMFYRILGIIGYNHLDEETDVFYSLNATLYESVEMANMYVEMLSQIFLWVGIVFAVFASLLMFNFISMSISNKRKEIGILRAVGARGMDVFKIFFAESGIIMGICLALSVVGSFVLCLFLNNLLRAEAGLMVTIFVFGIISVLMMLALAAVVALISTFLPVFFAARKKPVESIRAL